MSSTIKMMVKYTSARCMSVPQRITTGMRGLEVHFDFSDEWNGLDKTAVCICNGVAKLHIEDDMIVIPENILSVGNLMLKIGVFGRNEDESIIIPTNYVPISNVEIGTSVHNDVCVNTILSEHSAIPECPAVNGSYTLKCKIENAIPVLYWVLDEE